MLGEGVSVVVATHNRAHLLPRLVEALAAQARDGWLDAVIVDDGSTDNTWPVLQRLAERYPFVRPVRQTPNAGQATARNVGWRAASRERVLFTDDDCVPQPGWARALHDALTDLDVVQGQTVPDPATAATIGPFGRSINATAELGYYQTCNIGYRRKALERVGGFDERFRRCGEDTDLAWRVKESGGRSGFAPDAVVHHDVRPSSIRMHLRDTRRWGESVLVVREHPQLRDLLHRRWFFRQSHPPAIAGAVGVALLLWPRRGPLRRLAGLALLGPYVDLRLRRWPLPGGPRRRAAAIPAALVADVAEVGVMAAASVRYRTLVL